MRKLILTALIAALPFAASAANVEREPAFGPTALCMISSGVEFSRVCLMQHADSEAEALIVAEDTVTFCPAFARNNPAAYAKSSCVAELAYIKARWGVK